MTFTGFAPEKIGMFMRIMISKYAILVCYVFHQTESFSPVVPSCKYSRKLRSIIPLFNLKNECDGYPEVFKLLMTDICNKGC